MPIIPPADIRSDVVKLIPALRHFATRFCRNPSEADDLVQETLVKALGAIDSFQPGTRLKSWLFTIMRHVYCTHYKRQKRVVLGLEGIETWMLSRPATQEWTLRGMEIEGAIAELLDHYRQVVELVLIEGKSYDEAATLTRCALGTVKSRVNRAREKLAMAMGDSTQEAMQI